MKYENVVTRISELTGNSVEVVRNILLSIPEVLINMQENEVVRTPLGVFRMTRRASRTVTPPLGGDAVQIPEEMVVKLRAGNRMRKPIPRD